MWLQTIAASAESEPSKTFFYVVGGALAVWAVAVSVLGLTRADFPRGPGTGRAVSLISVLLVALVLAATIVTN